MKIINKNETSSTIIVHGNNLKKQIAFTYDTGFEYLEAEEILKVLKFHKIKCTFFITGIWAKKFPELLNTMVREGHEIGNHSLDHHYMTKISYNDMIKTVIDGEKAIEEITGLKTTLFRLPFGHWNDEVLKAVYESGYKYNIYWSIDTLDWSIPSI